jgi:L-2,4-diaminobutyrate transaminase
MRAALGDHPHVGEIRGEGLIMAVEFVKDRGSREGFDLDLAIPKKIVAEAGAQGLIARAMPTGHSVGFSPPLCITEEEVDRVVEIFGKAVGFVLKSS